MVSWFLYHPIRDIRFLRPVPCNLGWWPWSAPKLRPTRTGNKSVTTDLWRVWRFRAFNWSEIPWPHIIDPHFLTGIWSQAWSYFDFPARMHDTVGVPCVVWYFECSGEFLRANSFERKGRRTRLSDCHQLFSVTIHFYGGANLSVTHASIWPQKTSCISGSRLSTSRDEQPGFSAIMVIDDYSFFWPMY